MKEILFVTNTMGLAGAEKALIELMRALPRERCHISLYSLIGRGELFAQVPEDVCLLNPAPDTGSVLGAGATHAMEKCVLGCALRHGTIFRRAPYLLRNLRAMQREKHVQKDKLLWRVLSDGSPRFSQKYDLAVAFLEGGASYYVADHVNAAHKAAFVHIDYLAAGYNPSLDEGCYDAFERIYAVSEEVRQKFLRVHPECADRSALFHNLLDVDRIRTLSTADGGFSDSFDGTRLLSIGRLHPQKGYPASIRVLRRLVDAGLNVRWYVLGEGPERAPLEALIRENHLEDRFILLGAVMNPYPYLRQADLYIHTTRFEGKSVAIEEAQVLGKPIVASDCTGNREQIRNGENGLLVPLDEEEIFKAIERLIRHPQEAAELAAHSSYDNPDKQKNIDALLRICGG